MRSYIWTWPIRAWHWLTVLFVAAAYLTSEWERLLPWHAAFGYGVGVLLLFRVVWGFVGGRYERFAAWPLSRKELKKFLANPFNPPLYPGHNPAASWVMLGILVALGATVATGVLTYGVQEGRGPLRALNATLFGEMEWFEELHEAAVSVLLTLIGVHLLGVASDRVLHPHIGTLRSIVTGYKRLDAPDARLSFAQTLFAAAMLTLGALTPLYAALGAPNVLTQSRYTPVDYAAQHPDFVEECGACHTLYAPFLLPEASWRALMRPDALANHFGDDASLDEPLRASIERYLVANAAEHSAKEAAVYIRRSLEGNATAPLAVTDTPYWKKRHAAIDKTLFSHPKVRAKSNCKACHGDIEKGLIEDGTIKLPKQER